MFNLKKKCLLDTHKHIMGLTKELNEEIKRMVINGEIELIQDDIKNKNDSNLNKNTEYREINSNHIEPTDEVKKIFKRVLKKFIRKYHPDKNIDNNCSDYEEKTIKLLEICNSTFSVKDLFEIINDECDNDIVDNKDVELLYDNLKDEIGVTIDNFYKSLEWQYIRTNDHTILEQLLSTRGFKIKK